MGVLSKTDILKHLEKGNIVIDPFNEENLSNTSYDVRLGRYFYRQNENQKKTQTLNPFHKKSVKKLYPQASEARRVEELKSGVNPFHSLDKDDLVILVSPSETILAHTIEFVGGKNGNEELSAVTTTMKARSSLGRIGIDVCKSAGWGDIGFINRWTMEITNFSSITIPLVVGMRIAQIVFMEVTPIDKEDEYQEKGKYQSHSEMKKIKETWKPEDMLPRLHEDKDVGRFTTFH